MHRINSNFISIWRASTSSLIVFRKYFTSELSGYELIQIFEAKKLDRKWDIHKVAPSDRSYITVRKGDLRFLLVYLRKAVTHRLQVIVDFHCFQISLDVIFVPSSLVGVVTGNKIINRFGDIILRKWHVDVFIVPRSV